MYSVKNQNTVISNHVQTEFTELHLTLKLQCNLYSESLSYKQGYKSYDPRPVISEVNFIKTSALLLIMTVSLDYKNSGQNKNVTPDPNINLYQPYDALLPQCMHMVQLAKRCISSIQIWCNHNKISVAYNKIKHWHHQILNVICAENLIQSKGIFPAFHHNKRLLASCASFLQSFAHTVIAHLIPKQFIDGGP
jgi:hypothetical protein